MCGKIIPLSYNEFYLFGGYVDRISFKYNL